MEIYLKHPEYGTKVACMELEAKADEKNGWVRYDPRQMDLVLPQADVVPLNAMAQGARPRRRDA